MKATQWKGGDIFSNNGAGEWDFHRQKSKCPCET